MLTKHFVKNYNSVYRSSITYMGASTYNMIIICTAFFIVKDVTQIHDIFTKTFTTVVAWFCSLTQKWCDIDETIFLFVDNLEDVQGLSSVYVLYNHFPDSIFSLPAGAFGTVRYSTADRWLTVTEYARADRPVWKSTLIVLSFVNLTRGPLA
jgi:hypothetical protein